jgi:hypothetical protein
MLGWGGFMPAAGKHIMMGMMETRWRNSKTSIERNGIETAGVSTYENSRK